jgi:hypothetical protein
MIRPPVLIQRGEIKRPLVPATVRLSQAVNFDHMGSAEFEFGAEINSFRRIEEVADSWKCRIVEDIKEGDTPLQVWSALTDKEFKEYVKYLKILRAPRSDRKVKRFRTKASVRFEEDHEPGQFSKTDFWWDITNDVMFGFHKEFMKRVGDHVAASLAFMNKEGAGS